MPDLRRLLSLIFLNQLVISALLAAPPDEDDEEFRPGLVAEYRAGERFVTRIDPDVAFAWDEAAPDARLSAERFEGTWRGFLLVRQEGRHRLHAFVQGDVTVELDGQRVLHGSAKQPQWISGDEFAPGFGERPLVVTFRKTEKTAQLKLFWSSDSFSLEPLPPELLFHDDTSFNPNANGVGANVKPTPAPDTAPALADGVAVKQTDEFLALIERGRQQYAAFRCGRCHVREGDAVAPTAPALHHVAAGMTFEQIVKRLAPALNSPDATAVDRRMPHFRLKEEQARQLARFLMKQSETIKLEEVKTPKPKPAKEGEAVVTPQRRGELLLRSVGCLACHRLGELGNSNELPFAGPDLTQIGQRRSAAWLLTWLTNPQRINADHRMPIFSLTDEERQSIVLALKPTSDLSLRSDGSPRSRPGDRESSADDLAAGRKLFAEHRCAACHRTTDPKLAEFARAKSDLSRPTDWSQGCLNESWVNDNQQHPIYLRGLDRAAIKAFLSSRWNRTLSRESQFLRGMRMLEEKNCFACHPRHGGIGLGQTAKLVAATDNDLNGQAPALVAPSLNAIGDKLLDEALNIAVRGERQPIRMPWLKVRMPKFQHSPEELATLTRYFVEHDRIPFVTRRGEGETTREGEQLSASSAVLSPSPPLPVSPSAETHLAGQALTGVRGWSCIACHKIGDYEPKQVALGARGSDLKMLGKHLRPEFFFRWIASPLRVIPGVEMPQFNRPVAGVLDGNLSLQHAALWQALNDPNFQPPTNPANVEQLWVVNPGERPRIIRDVFQLPKELGGGTVPRSFAVGFDNGHSFLFDLDTASLRQWTFGDFARQQAIGKRWLWEMAGVTLGEGTAVPEFRLKRLGVENADFLFPTKTDQLIYENTKIEGQEAVRRRWLMTFGTDKNKHVLEISELWVASVDPDTKSSVVERLLAVRQLLIDGHSVDFQIRCPKVVIENGAATKVTRTSRLSAKNGQDKWEDLPLKSPDADGWYQVTIGPVDSVEVLQKFGTSLPPPPRTIKPNPPMTFAAQTVQSVPGFDGTQLPIDSSIMPTALTWTHDKRLAFTSLKGHVFVADDSDQDGIEDKLELVEEGLAAPYGIIDWSNTEQNPDLPKHLAFLVAHKAEITGVSNVLSGGAAGTKSRFVFAGGWGYNDDYHDWTCGIARDSHGRLFIGLGSDYTDKNRPAKVSRWRGKVLRLDTEELTEKTKGPEQLLTLNDRLVKPVGHAFRYPTGIAINERDEVFVSDQQGVQNCFNEINYLVEGAHYGVPSTHEEDKDAPETKAAIQIPHPWTRSVNGLCFLTGREGYPDLKGHGIGCEYNGRFLIRFTTQRVGDVMQGAVYPFSKPDYPKPEENFEGPLCCGVSPKGEIYIGSISDSGWAGGQNTGSIVKLKGNGQRPNGIREIRATPDGFDIEFFAPVDPVRATNAEHYSISGYTRVWGGAYATPDSDRHRCKVLHVKLSADGQTARLKVEPRKTPNYVYDISCREVAEPGKSLWPDYGFFTLHKIP